MGKKQVYQTPEIEVMTVEHNSFLNAAADPDVCLPDTYDSDMPLKRKCDNRYNNQKNKRI